MTLEQLNSELNAIKNPLMARSKDAMTRVFTLYKTLTGKEPRGTGCYGCALDAFEELKTIAHRGRGWDNSLNLPDELTKSFQNKIIMSQLKKYKLKRPFRVFGSSDFYTEHNLDDKKVELLLKQHPSLIKHFEKLEKEEAEKPKAKTAKAKAEKPKEEKSEETESEEEVESEKEGDQ